MAEEGKQERKRGGEKVRGVLKSVIRLILDYYNVGFKRIRLLIFCMFLIVNKSH